MPHHRRSAKASVEHDMMRCVVDETGALVFASPALGWALGQSAAALAGKPVKSVLNIIASLDSKHGKLDLPNLQAGFYEVALLRSERDPLLVQARIDTVDAPGNRKLTVIWLDPDQKLKRRKGEEVRAAAQEFAVFAGDSQKKAAAAKPVDANGPGSILTDEGELRHFLNLTNDMLAVYRRDLSFVRVNPAFNRTLGYSDAELKLFPFSDLIHPEDKEQALQLMQRVIAAPLEQEVRVDFECRVLCRDGGFRRIEWIHKAAGGHIYIVGHDVTDIRAHEVELQRREQLLSEAQKIGRMGHWHWELEQDRMEWSDQIYSIFGVDKASFTPTIAGIGSLVLKRDFSRIGKAVQRARLRKKDYALEFRIRRPGGSMRYLRCEGRCRISPKTGEVEALFGIMQDVTERTLHEQALYSAKEAAEHAYASKSRFLANMSHELRTPLNAIIGFSEMIQRQLFGPVGTPRYLDYIGRIHQSGEHLLDLINDILDMSKIEVGKYELHAEELNVGKIIRLALHMVEGRAHESQVRLVSDDITDDIHITADRRALMQVLLNLLSNAVKFTKSGGIVEIRCHRELGGVAIVVSDTGIGIPREKLNIVTMPFEQVDSEFTRRHEGTGLGLAITKDLVEMHGGTLDIDSEVGVGTTVTVLLPGKIPEARRAG